MTGFNLFSLPGPGDRQVYPETRARAGLRLHRNSAEMVLDDALAHEQPETRPPLFAREEGLEHLLAVLGRHADAVVGDLDTDHVLALLANHVAVAAVVHPAAHGNGPFRRHRLGGVLEKIDQDLDDLIGIDLYQ